METATEAVMSLDTPLPRLNAFLCDLCKTLFSNAKHSILEEFDLHANASSLKQSSETGCRLCAQVWHRLLATGLVDSTTDLKNTNAISCRIGNDPDAERVPLGVYDWHGMWVCFMLGTSGHEIAAFMVLAAEGRFSSDAFDHLNANDDDYLKHSSTASIGSINAAKEWMRRCTEKHEHCRVSSLGSSPPPTRLIHVEKTQAGLEAYICEGDAVSESAKYLTLSHCWGSGPVFTLVSDNLEMLKRNVPVERLPKVFQDTLSMAIELGINYVWIDSLCILQDSKEDWRLESSRMGRVYKGAWCNIAATAFSDGSLGMFSERHPELIQPLKVHVDIILQGHHSYGYYYLVDRVLWETSVEKAPLNRRAWVLQERTLSPRIIHFGKDQLFWECSELEACEMFPAGIPREISTEKYKARCPLTQNNDSGGISKSKLDRKDFSVFWWLVVTAYTKCSLTYSTDKLIAISGLAEELRTITGDEYVYGLWRRDLVQQLHWRVDIDTETLPRPREYRAPSWSWASIDSIISVNVPRDEEKGEVKLLAAVEDVGTENAVDGQRNSADIGWIRICGSLTKAWLPKHKSRESINFKWLLFNARPHSIAICLDTHADDL